MCVRTRTLTFAGIFYNTAVDFFVRRSTVIVIHEDFRCVSFIEDWIRSSNRMRFCLLFFRWMFAINQARRLSLIWLNEANIQIGFLPPSILFTLPYSWFIRALPLINAECTLHNDLVKSWLLQIAHRLIFKYSTVFPLVYDQISVINGDGDEWPWSIGRNFDISFISKYFVKQANPLWPKYRLIIKMVCAK